MMLVYRHCIKSFQLADNGKETEKGTNIVYFNVPFNLLIGG